MKAEKNLGKLLAGMKPTLDAGEYCFHSGSEKQVKALKPVMTFRESEGITAIARHNPAWKGKHECGWNKITLSVRSDLNAVGFLAAVSGELARRRIGVNAVSAFHHDYLFVPKEKAAAALSALRWLSAGARK